MSRRRSRSPSPGRFSRACNSNDPRDLERRIFVGNLPTSDMTNKDLEDLFAPYGKILGVSLLRGYGFVQFERIEEAEAARAAQKGRMYRGYKIDVNMAVERRQAKPQSQQSPPRRASYGKEPRPRSRSPVYSRDGREPRNGRESRDSRDARDAGRDLGRDAGRDAGRDPGRDAGRDPGRDAGRDPGRDAGRDPGRDPGRDLGRDPGRDPGRDLGRDPGRDLGRDPGRDLGRDPGRDLGRDPGRDLGRDPGRDLGRDPGRDLGREPRPESHSRDPNYRYRSGSRDKDIRGPPRDPAYREDFDRYYRGASGAEDYYRRKEEPFREPFLDPWNGRREPDDRARPEERRRNELYRQYFEELQRRYDTDRPVDCSVIVVNKVQNREYAETVGRKVRDLGMVVDLIFLNTEVSLTQALEDVGRARTPFAIIITQQHQVHRSCTVNILFGTPQEHRNMPMQDAMMLVAHNYDTYKVENREKEREEIARKAAKMADDVLLREADRETHPTSVLTSVTLLSENRFLTPEELDRLIAYLQDKRARLVRSSGEPLAAPVNIGPSAGVHHDVPPMAAGLPPPSSRPPAPSSHLSAGSSASANPNHQQELQAKILSLFNSGSGPSPGNSGGGIPSAGAPQPHPYSSIGPSPSQNPSRPPMSGPPPAAPQSYNSPPGRMPGVSAAQRPPVAASCINLDNPSVQKALDTLIQSGPTFNNLVGPGSTQQPPPRPAPNMGQAPPMSMYPRHY